VAQRTIRQYEDVAAAVVAEIEKGRWKKLDVHGAAPATHDYDVVAADGRRIALEVTSAANNVEISMWNAISARDWECPSLRHSWQLSVVQPGSKALSVRQLHGQVERLLGVLEGGDVREIEADTPNESLPQDIKAAIAELRSLGVRRARCWPDLVTHSGVPTVLVGASGAFSTAPQEVNDAVEREAKANTDKLAKAEADERHLFVWVHPTSGGPELMLYTGQTAEVPPQLPDVIDVAWVARFPDTAEGPVSTLWRVQRHGSWQVVRRRPPDW
jgi:hypothetical protein